MGPLNPARTSIIAASQDRTVGFLEAAGPKA